MANHQQHKAKTNLEWNLARRLWSLANTIGLTLKVNPDVPEKLCLRKELMSDNPVMEGPIC